MISRALKKYKQYLLEANNPIPCDAYKKRLESHYGAYVLKKYIKSELREAARKTRVQIPLRTRARNFSSVVPNVALAHFVNNQQVPSRRLCVFVIFS